jgi:hypothetical protein
MYCIFEDCLLACKGVLRVIHKSERCQHLLTLTIMGEAAQIMFVGDQLVPVRTLFLSSQTKCGITRQHLLTLTIMGESAQIMFVGDQIGSGSNIIFVKLNKMYLL